MPVQPPVAATLRTASDAPPPAGKWSGTAERLALELRQRGIRYGVWKGSFGLRNVAAGERDLDLLLLPQDLTPTRQVLRQLGFQELMGNRVEELPGTCQYLGFDAEASTFLQVHLHTQLVLGHPLRKLYHVPWEAACLESLPENGIWPVVSPEWELLLFVLRMLVLGLHPAAAPQAQQTPTWPARRQGEWSYLQERADPYRVAELLAEWLPWLQPAWWNACEQAIERGSSAPSRSAAQAVLDGLGKYRMERGWKHTWSVAAHRLRRAFHRRVLRRAAPKPALSAGGMAIAVVGGDGAGKSTLLAQLRQWLHPHLQVCSLHLGKPRQSFSTRALRGLLRAARTVARRPLNIAHSVVDGRPLSFSETCWLWCAARDRRRALQVVTRRAASQVVLCDRWPLPGLMSMDGPQLVGGDNWWGKWFARREQQLYAGLKAPDCLIVLRLNPETAVRRKPEERPEFVRSRSQLVWDTCWEGTGAWVVDAAQPVEIVLAQVQAHVWRCLAERPEHSPSN